MAGGKGKRLKQFTNYFPKPLVPIQNTTALEYIINMFKMAGTSKFFISLNYKKSNKILFKRKQSEKFKLLRRKKFTWYSWGY